MLMTGSIRLWGIREIELGEGAARGLQGKKAKMGTTDRCQGRATMRRWKQSRDVILWIRHCPSRLCARDIAPTDADTTLRWEGILSIFASHGCGRRVYAGKHIRDGHRRWDLLLSKLISWLAEVILHAALSARPALKPFTAHMQSILVKLPKCSLRDSKASVLAYYTYQDAPWMHARSDFVAHRGHAHWPEYPYPSASFVFITRPPHALFTTLSST